MCKIKRIAAYVMTMVILFVSLGMVPSDMAQHAQPAYFQSSAGHRLMDVFEQELYELRGNNLGEIGSIKELKDLAGNEYYVAETEPQGYMIYNKESGLIVEASPESVSPYAGYDTDIYYHGPTYYFHMEEDGTLKHTVLSEKITADEYSEMLKHEEINDLQNNFNEYRDTAVLEYVENNRPIAETYSYQDGDGYTMVHKNTYFLQQRENFYDDCGCGYNAMALLIGFHQFYSGRQFIPTQFFYTTTPCSFACPILKSGFTNYLYEAYGTPRGYGSILNEHEIDIILKAYFEDINVDAKISKNGFINTQT